MEFAGKAVVICDAVSDVGRACSEEFARQGAQIFLIDKDQQKLSSFAETLSASYSNVRTKSAHLGTWDEAKAAAEWFQSQASGLHVLITCAMALDFTSIEESAPEIWQQVITQNLLGPIFATKAFLDPLKRERGASIVHIGSIDGLFGNPTIPSYSVSKGGLIPFTHVSASEFGRFGIRVNCIGRSMSQDSEGFPSAVGEALLPHTPLGRIATSREIASVVRFLASDAAAYVNGVVLPVDGGRTSLTAGTRPQEQSSFRAAT